MIPTEQQSGYNHREVWHDIHEQACAKGEFFYRDPATGYLVFTRVKHIDRGHCCKSGCRHCPYGNSPLDKKS